MKEKISILGLIRAYFFSYPFYVVAMFALITSTGNLVDYLLIHAMLWIPGYLYWLRERAGRFSSHGKIVILHTIIFLMLLPYIVMGRPDAVFIVLVLLLFLFFSSLSLLTTGITLSNEPGTLILFGALFLVLFFNAKSNDLQFYLTLASMIMVFLCWSILHCAGVDAILKNSSHILQQDEKFTRRRSHLLFLLACLCTLVLVFMLLFLGMDEMFGMVITPVLRSAQRLFRLIFPLAEGVEESLPFEDSTWFHPQGRKWWVDLINGNESSSFWLVMEYLLIFSFVALLLLGSIWVFRRMRRKHISPATPPVYCEEKELYIENLSRVKQTSKPNDLQSVSRIRRLYRKTVLKKIKEGLSVTPAKTPGEIRREINTPAFDALSELYEKARYTEEHVSIQDLAGVEEITKLK